jgi:hypothetical protein
VTGVKRNCGRLAAVVGCVLVAATAGPRAASADPSLLFGFTDNLPMVLGSDATTRERALGAHGIALILTWHRGETTLTTGDAKGLAKAIGAASGMRVILSVMTLGAGTPLDDPARDQFCTYAKNVIASFPSVNDIVIGNEANSSFFWRPQYNPDGTSAAPAAYETLLARCYDVLHAFRPGINVAAPATGPHGNDNPNAVSNISHSPTSFIVGLADAYRASGRTRRIFDTVVHHPYGNTNDERPYLMHPRPQSIGEGDWNRLVQTYQDAFAGTAQPVPGRCFAGSPCVPIWYVEMGFQTSVPAGSPLYFGAENVRTVPDFASVVEPVSPSPPATSTAPDQGRQLGYALRLAYCQPYVEGAFNFLVRDDPNLAGYQSGIFWPDWRQKGSYSTLVNQVANLAAGRVSCTPPSAPSGLAAQIGPGGGEVDLTWGGSSSSIGVSGYTIYRDGTPVGTTTDLDFQDRAVAPGSTSTYTVRAYDAAGGTSDPSEGVAIATPAATPPPPAPLPPPPPPPLPSPPAPMPVLPSPPPPPVVAPGRAPRGAHVRQPCIVPRLLGKTLGGVSRLLSRRHCRLGHVARPRLRVLAEQPVVVSQSPRAGTRLRRNGRVNVTLGRAKGR